MKNVRFDVIIYISAFFTGGFTWQKSLINIKDYAPLQWTASDSTRDLVIAFRFRRVL